MPSNRTREESRLLKRKQRRALHERGLNSEGFPRKGPNLLAHPKDCLCYDCLWSKYDEAERDGRRVLRVLQSGRKALSDA